jgi:hypothetical protein
VPLLDELDEAIGSVEGELHPPEDRRTYVRLQGDLVFTNDEGRLAAALELPC